MWWQCLLVSVFILLVSFGGDTASAFYNKLTLMANVSMTLPYLFLTLAFPFFKAKQDLDRPFVIFKHRGSTLLATAVVVLVVAFANIFTVIEPVMEAGDWSSALWMVGGPRRAKTLALPAFRQGRSYRLPGVRLVFPAEVSALLLFLPSMLSRRIWNGGNGISIPCSRNPARISWCISWRSGIR